MLLHSSQHVKWKSICSLLCMKAAAHHAMMMVAKKCIQTYIMKNVQCCHFKWQTTLRKMLAIFIYIFVISLASQLIYRWVVILFMKMPFTTSIHENYQLINTLCQYNEQLAGYRNIIAMLASSVKFSLSITLSFSVWLSLAVCIRQFYVIKQPNKCTCKWNNGKYKTAHRSMGNNNGFTKSYATETQSIFESLRI